MAAEDTPSWAVSIREQVRKALHPELTLQAWGAYWECISDAGRGVLIASIFDNGQSMGDDNNE